MPSEDAELIRDAFDRWNAGEREFAEIHPELELSSPLASTRGEPYRGREGFTLWLQDIDEQFDRWELRPTEWRDLPDGRVFALGSIHLRGRESGIEIDQPAAWLFELRDGMVYRMTIWASHEQALGSLGLG